MKPDLFIQHKFIRDIHHLSLKTLSIYINLNGANYIEVSTLHQDFEKLHVG